MRELARLGLAPRFAGLVCARGHRRARKPHPEALHVGLDAARRRRVEAACVGDSPEDVEMARAAGVLSVGVPKEDFPIARRCAARAPTSGRRSSPTRWAQLLRAAKRPAGAMTAAQIAALFASSFGAGVDERDGRRRHDPDVSDAALSRGAGDHGQRDVDGGALARLRGEPLRIPAGGARAPRLARDALPAEPPRRSARRGAAAAHAARTRSRSLAPFLVLFATLLFMLQGAVSRWTGAAPRRRPTPGPPRGRVARSSSASRSTAATSAPASASSCSRCSDSSGSRTSTPPTA